MYEFHKYSFASGDALKPFSSLQSQETANWNVKKNEKKEMNKKQKEKKKSQYGLMIKLDMYQVRTHLRPPQTSVTCLSSFGPQVSE